MQIYAQVHNTQALRHTIQVHCSPEIAVASEAWATFEDGLTALHALFALGSSFSSESATLWNTAQQRKQRENNQLQTSDLVIRILKRT